MATLPLLVGESPSRTGDRYWRWPLSGAPARTLCQCAGWDPETDDGKPPQIADWSWALYDRFDTVNLFPRWHLASPWRLPEARNRAEGILEEILVGAPRPIVLLGAKVREAFEAGPFFEWREIRGLQVVVLPHPSGRNLLLNDPETRSRIGTALREAVALTRPD